VAGNLGVYEVGIGRCGNWVLRTAAAAVSGGLGLNSGA